MDDFMKAIEIAQKLTEYVKSRPSIKIASLVFLTALILFFTTSLPAVSSILSAMNETIRAWIFFIMLTSGVYSVSAIIVNLAEYLYDKKKAEKQKAKEETLIKQQLSNLGNNERQILKYALTMSGNVWLPAENINVLPKSAQSRNNLSNNGNDYTSGRLLSRLSVFCIPSVRKNKRICQ